VTEPAFDNLLSTIASTEDDLADGLRADLQAEGSTIANLSPFSAFFRLLVAVFATPLLELRRIVLEDLLPGLFWKTATGSLLDILADGRDLTRLVATAAQGSLTFSRAGSVGDLTIPAGTIVESPEIDGVVYRMVTDADTDILDGNTSALVAATAEAVGAAYNLGDGFYSILPNPPPGVTGVSNDAGWLTASGTDTETDSGLRERGRQKIASLGQGTTGYYTAIIAAFQVVPADDVFFDDYPASRGFGSRDAFVLLDSGNPSAAQLTALNAHIADDANHLDGDDLQVFALPGLSVNFIVAALVDAGTPAAETATIQTGIEDRARAVFRQSAAFGALPRVRPNETVALAALTDEIRGAFPKVRSIDYTPGVISPALQLPILQTLTVTVN